MSDVLIDTHILLWILQKSKRLKTLSWLDDYPIWTLSPVSLMEIKFLNEIGRFDLDFPKVIELLKNDERFSISSVPLAELCFQAFEFSWTRDPFDRLLVAHSLCLNIPLGTCDQLIRKNYSNVVK